MRIRNHQDCAHRWAAQRGDSGRSGPLFYRYRTIYSYGSHYPIATFAAPRVVYFNPTGSTMTTMTKHRPPVLRALHGLDVLIVQVPPRYWDSPADVLDYLRAQYDAAIERARAATRHTRAALADAARIVGDMIALAAAFQLPKPAIPQPADIAALNARADAQDAAADARAVARRACRAAQDAERYAVQLRNDTLEPWWTAAKRAASLIDAGRWLAGESIPGFYLDSPTLLRVHDGRIETSRGATVGMASARRLWDMARSIKAAGTSQGFARGSFDVDGFALRHIDADGTVTIGCHVLRMEHMAPVAAALGW